MNNETKYGILLAVTVLVVISFLFGPDEEETDDIPSPLLVFGR